MPILGGIVIALILIGLFALPMLMPGPMGGGGGVGDIRRERVERYLPLGLHLQWKKGNESEEVFKGIGVVNWIGVN